MRSCFLILIGALLAAGSAHAQKESNYKTTIEPAKRTSSLGLERGITLFLKDSLTEALPLFQQAIIDEPRNPDAYAWLAETYRRTEKPDDAYDMAQFALTLQPCHAQAQTTLGDLYNPQYSSWERTSLDSAVARHLMAVECDPGEGVAWFGLWIEGMRVGSEEIERRALKSLASSGFITPGALAYARWALGSLPKNAILLTNGDMDTYPLVALQESQGFRKDVAVINSSLLNLNWYGSLMTRRHAIVGGYTADEIEMLENRDVDAEIVNTVGRQVIARWAEARRKGKLKRPLAIGVGVIRGEVIGDLENFTLAGPYWLHDTGKKPRLLDAGTLWSSLRALNTADFSGTFVSPRDRSPIRRAYSAPTAGAAVTGDLWRAVEAMREMGTPEATRESEKLVEWMEKFYSATGNILEEE